MERMRELNEAYRRLKHYTEAFGGIYIYPEYQKDLQIIMQFVGQELTGLEDMLYEHIPNAMI